MNPTLQKIADILPGILRNAIPVPSGPCYVIELEGAEMDALRELNEMLQQWKRSHPTPNSEVINCTR